VVYPLFRIVQKQEGTRAKEPKNISSFNILQKLAKKYQKMGGKESRFCVRERVGVPFYILRREGKRPCATLTANGKNCVETVGTM